MKANVFRPSSVSPHAQVTSSGTADVQSLAAPASASALLATVETTACYMTFDGTTPSATNGIFLPTGVVHFLPVAAGLTVKIASSAAAASKVNGAWLV